VLDKLGFEEFSKRWKETYDSMIQSGSTKLGLIPGVYPDDPPLIMPAKINALSMQNNEEVNKFVDKAIAAGGNEPIEAKDYGFMFQRSIEDPDGHIWEVFYMDMSKIPAQ
jgi:hypothetical protein